MVSTNQVEANHQGVAIIVQEIGTLSGLTVAENIFLGNEDQFTKCGIKNTAAMNKKAQEYLDSYGFNYIDATKVIDDYNFEDRKLVEIVKSTYFNPKVLVVDETTTALGQKGREELFKVMHKVRDTGNCVIFISHDLDEAMRIGDRIAIMQNGEVVQVGTPDEILNNPANDYVRTFFRGVDISQVFSAKDIARRSPVGLIRKTPGFGPRSALKLLQDEDREYGYVIERGNRFVGIVSIDSLKTALSAGQGIEAALIDAPLAVEAQTPLSDLLSHVGHAPCAVPVVDEEQQYIGIISKRMLLQALDREGVNHG